MLRRSRNLTIRGRMAARRSLGVCAAENRCDSRRADDERELDVDHVSPLRARAVAVVAARCRRSGGGRAGTISGFRGRRSGGRPALPAEGPAVEPPGPSHAPPPPCAGRIVAGPGALDMRNRGSHAAPAGRQDGGGPSNRGRAVTRSQRGMLLVEPRVSHGVGESVAALTDPLDGVAADPPGVARRRRGCQGAPTRSPARQERSAAAIPRRAAAGRR